MRICAFLCCMQIGLLLSLNAGAYAQPNPPQPSKLSAMINVLISENTEMKLREDHASALLQDPAAYPELVKLLTSDQNDSAKIIICRIIADQIDDGDLVHLRLDIAQNFVDPLFQTLFSQNQQLSAWSARALAKCHDGIPNRLAKIVSDKTTEPDKRLAAIKVLEMIPEKSSALALAGLLDDENEDIRKSAADALSQILGLQQPIDAQKFKDAYLDPLSAMDEHEFLRRQLLLRQKRIDQVQNHCARLEEQIQLWRQRYLDVMNTEFDWMATDQEKFDFINSFLQANRETPLQIWALEKIGQWASIASVQTGPVADSLVGILIPFIGGPDSHVRQLTAEALAKLINKAQPAAPALLEQLKKEQNPQAQAALLEILGMFDQQTPLAEQAMLLLQSPHPVVVAPAARALKNICATANLSDEQLITVAKDLAQCYRNWPDSLPIRQELLLAMRPLAAKESLHAHAVTYFDEILRAAVDDPQENIRSAAVRTITVLHHYQVLPFLLQTKKLLDDPGPAVRFAVIDAVRDYGSKEHLNLLTDRLSREENADVAKAIRDTIIKILLALPSDDIRQFDQALNGDNHQTYLLHSQIIHSLWDKIAKDKAAGQNTDPAIEQYALIQLADIAAKEDLAPEAVKWLQMLIAMDLPPQQKNMYHNTIIQLALKNNTQGSLLNIARQSLAFLAAQPNAANTTFDQIEKYCQTLDIQDPLQLLRKGTILAELIVPLLNQMPDPLKLKWTQLCSQCAINAIDNQLAALNASNGKEDPQFIQLLPRLDSRLNNFPSTETVDKKKSALNQYKKILAPPPVEKTPPKQPPVQPNPQTPDQDKNPQDQPAPPPASNNTSPVETP